MFSIIISFFVAFVICDEPLLISVPFNIKAPQACRYAGLYPARLTLRNVIQYYNLIANTSDVQAAYVQSWQGNNSGWVMKKNGEMIPYRQYRLPVYYALCNQQPNLLGETTDAAAAPAGFGKSYYEEAADDLEYAYQNPSVVLAAAKKLSLAPRRRDALERRERVEEAGFQAAAAAAAAKALRAPIGETRETVRATRPNFDLDAAKALRSILGETRGANRPAAAPAAAAPASYQYECRMVEY